MNLKKIGLIILVVVLAGCANPMPEENYVQKAGFVGMFERCHEANYIDSDLYSKTLPAFNLQLNTWSFDEQKLQSQIQQAYFNSTATPLSCEEAEQEAMQYMAEAMQNRTSKHASLRAAEDSAQSTSGYWERSLRNPNP